MKTLKKLLRKLIAPNHKYYISDYVQIGSASEVYEIVARYYDEDLQLIYILRTSDNKLTSEREKYVNLYKGTLQ
jgi:hypothetical protein